MRRQARIDHPGAVHHAMLCGVAQRAGHYDEADVARLLVQLAGPLERTKA